MTEPDLRYPIGAFRTPERGGPEQRAAWLAQLTAPINLVAGVAGLVFLVAFRFFWKLRS